MMNKYPKNFYTLPIFQGCYDKLYDLIIGNAMVITVIVLILAAQVRTHNHGLPEPATIMTGTCYDYKK